ncbi:hypothetical protein [Rubellicoccus peritrichatus]|uniref:PEP-CTERM protein-sorting domain-containing protein n=1 Tax=Rubellicoccus peritrichatus TaxID=3080537 RepID=A0AAQ3LD77_9BACT|nr:hypothetical protein [Puniceicoccus sp. CR14]WOO41725.1 hypothetical protein RZN69_01395 [Puniceicoccus sp. CR14]
MRHSLTTLKALSLGSLFCLSNAQAALVGYWNMDSNLVAGKLPANAGSQAGTITSNYEEFAVGFEAGIDADITGTTENIIGVSSPNRSVGFYHLGVAFADGAFVMNNFDFTGLSDGSISFAVRGENFFTWDTNLDVDYRVNNGSWVDIAEGLVYSPGFNVANIDFGAALDGVSDVDLRIRTTSWLSISGFLDIDNIQVNAVPEPAAYAALFGLTGLALAVYRKRSKQA